jgi:hypothetical protein
VETIEERPRVGIEQRAVRIERAVLDCDRDLVVRAERICADTRGRPRKNGRSGLACNPQIVVGASAPDEVETGRPRVYVETRHAESVVVVPRRRGPLAVRVRKRGVTGAPVRHAG